MNEPEPRRPEELPEVEAWFDERFPKTALISDIDAVRDDMPPPVRAWWDAWQRYRHEHAAWRAKQPIDVDDCGARWRMFGGRWLSWKAYRADGVGLVLEQDGERATFYIMPAPRKLMPQLIERGVPEEKLRRVAELFYEREAIRDRADMPLARYVRELLEGEPK